MTAATPATRTVSPPATRLTTAASLLRSEWTKLRSIRSTIWTLILLVVVDLVFTALFTLVNVSQWNSDPQMRARTLADPAGAILGGGLEISQLVVCVLGVLVMTSEYATGMIRASVLAVPRRLPMFAAKATVFALLIFALGTAVSFASFALGAPILHSKAPVSLGGPGVLRAVIGGGLYLTMLGLFAFAVGALLRHTAAAITAVIGFVLVLAPLTQLLPGSVGKHIHAYLPSEAGHLIAQTHQAADDLLSPWQGYAVFGLWTALLLVLATFLLLRRDA
jgi:ABC-2 type transport system permease protein